MVGTHCKIPRVNQRESELPRGREERKGVKMEDTKLLGRGNRGLDAVQDSEEGEAQSHQPSGRLCM